MAKAKLAKHLAKYLDEIAGKSNDEVAATVTQLERRHSQFQQMFKNPELM